MCTKLAGPALMLCFWLLMWTEMLLSTIERLCIGNNFFPLSLRYFMEFLFSFFWQFEGWQFICQWAQGLLKVLHLEFLLPWGRTLSPSLRSAAHPGMVGHPSCLFSVSSPGLYSWEQDVFLLGIWTVTACVSHCVMPSLFDPPSVALGKGFAGSDHKPEFFSLFPCQSSLLLTAAEQPSSGHSLQSQTAGTLAVGWKY